jgi:hypothetical protein
VFTMSQIFPIFYDTGLNEFHASRKDFSMHLIITNNQLGFKLLTCILSPADTVVVVGDVVVVIEAVVAEEGLDLRTGMLMTIVARR